MGVKDDKIRIATSLPSLKNKIQVKIGEETDAIYWYIRFNIPLDESTVSEKTMDVTDTDGYIMRTDIAYNDQSNTIVISPLDSYEQDRYYLLNISKKVKSRRGQHLKWKIHILFKLVNNQISEYKILKKNVEVPKPKPRPRDYEKKHTKSKVYSFDNAILENVPQDRLPQSDIKVNVLLGLLGLAIVLGSIPFGQIILTVIGMLVCFVGIGHIVVQISKPELRATIAYNRGAKQFNKEKYEKAEVLFKKALLYDPENEMAEFALNKLSFYL